MWDISIHLRVTLKMNSVKLKAEFYSKLPPVVVYTSMSPVLFYIEQIYLLLPSTTDHLTTVHISTTVSIF